MACLYDSFKCTPLIYFLDLKKNKEEIKNRKNEDVFLINKVESIYVLEIKKGTIKKGKISKAKFKKFYYFIKLIFSKTLLLKG